MFWYGSHYAASGQCPSRCHTTRGHNCVYSATDEALDTLYTKASKRAYRFMHIFVLLGPFFFHLFFAHFRVLQVVVV
jgi:hypothetical protein